jgi:hypothetical protein
MSTGKTPKNGPDTIEPPPFLPAKWADRASFSLPEVAEIIGISPWSAYAAAKRGEIGVIRIGKREIVPRRVVERLLAG